MPSDNEFDYTPESRAVKAVAGDVKKVVEHFRSMRAAGFMDAKRSRATERMHQAITDSPLGSRLLAEGYPVAFAYRVAKLEKQRLVVPSLPDQGIANTLLSAMGVEGDPPPPAQPDPEAAV